MRFLRCRTWARGLPVGAPRRRCLWEGSRDGSLVISPQVDQNRCCREAVGSPAPFRPWTGPPPKPARGRAAAGIGRSLTPSVADSITAGSTDGIDARNRSGCDPAARGVGSLYVARSRCVCGGPRALVAELRHPRERTVFPRPEAERRADRFASARSDARLALGPTADAGTNRYAATPAISRISASCVASARVSSPTILPARKTRMRVDRLSTSGISLEMRMDAVAGRGRSSSMRPWISAFAPTSTPRVGSSRIRIGHCAAIHLVEDDLLLITARECGHWRIEPWSLDAQSREVRARGFLLDGPRDESQLREARQNRQRRVVEHVHRQDEPLTLAILGHEADAKPDGRSGACRPGRAGPEPMTSPLNVGRAEECGGDLGSSSADEPGAAQHFAGAKRERDVLEASRTGQVRRRAAIPHRTPHGRGKESIRRGCGRSSSRRERCDRLRSRAVATCRPSRSTVIVSQRRKISSSLWLT